MRVQLVLLKLALLCTAPGAVVKNWKVVIEEVEGCKQ